MSVHALGEVEAASTQDFFDIDATIPMHWLPRLSARLVPVTAVVVFLPRVKPRIQSYTTG